MHEINVILLFIYKLIICSLYTLCCSSFISPTNSTMSSLSAPTPVKKAPIPSAPANASPSTPEAKGKIKNLTTRPKNAGSSKPAPAIPKYITSSKYNHKYAQANAE